MKKDGIDLVIYKMLKSCIDRWLRHAEFLARFSWFSFSAKLQYFLYLGMCWESDDSAHRPHVNRF